MVGFGVRVGAATVDIALGLFAALVLGSSPVGFYFATRAVVLLRIGEPDTWFQGPVALVIGLFGEFFFVLPFAMVLVLLPDAVGWRSLGKRLFGFRVIAARRRSLMVRFLMGASPMLLAVVALIVGKWWMVEVALVTAGALMLGALVGTIRDSRPWVDRVSGATLEADFS